MPSKEGFVKFPKFNPDKEEIEQVYLQPAYNELDHFFKVIDSGKQKDIEGLDMEKLLKTMAAVLNEKDYPHFNQGLDKNSKKQMVEVLKSALKGLEKTAPPKPK